MADTAAAPAAPQTPAKAKKEKKAKKPKTNQLRPPTSQIVNNTIKGLKERGGSSLQAIKKYIAANYKVDTEKIAPFIKKYLKSAIASGSLVQTKGMGASGSFRVASAGQGDEKKKSPAEKVKKTMCGAKKPAAKKASKAKKSPSSPKPKKPSSWCQETRAKPKSKNREKEDSTPKEASSSSLVWQDTWKTIPSSNINFLNDVTKC